jgi:LPS O-antigen subunit length determinant protein (WzzB/FepE family)
VKVEQVEEQAVRLEAQNDRRIQEIQEANAQCEASRAALQAISPPRDALGQ